MRSESGWQKNLISTMCALAVVRVAVLPKWCFQIKPSKWGNIFVVLFFFWQSPKEIYKKITPFFPISGTMGRFLRRIRWTLLGIQPRSLSIRTWTLQRTRQTLRTCTYVRQLNCLQTKANEDLLLFTTFTLRTLNVMRRDVSLVETEEEIENNKETFS